MSRPAISASNSAAISGCSEKNGTVNAHRVTSRITNGTLTCWAISSHMENIREQKGPGAA